MTTRIVDHNGRPFRPDPVSEALRIAADRPDGFALAEPRPEIGSASRIAQLRESCGEKPTTITFRRSPEFRKPIATPASAFAALHLEFGYVEASWPSYERLPIEFQLFATGPLRVNSNAPEWKCDAPSPVKIGYLGLWSHHQGGRLLLPMIPVTAVPIERGDSISFQKGAVRLPSKAYEELFAGLCEARKGDQ